MNIYLRKILKHDITHQISVTKEILNGFFGVFEEKESTQMRGKHSGFIGTVTFLLSTDPRFGGEIKQIITNEGGMDEDDILLFVKSKTGYVLEIITKADSRHSTFINIMQEERHLIVNVDEETLESNNEKFNYNVYGMHIKKTNDALSEERPHICIGWSAMGDLTQIKSKDELNAKHQEVYPNLNAKAKGQNVGQIWRFINEMQIGDYVVFADGDLCHIGRIESDYYFDNKTYPNQSGDYLNVRDVKWLKTNIKRSELSKSFHRSLTTAMSVWGLNDYKSVVYELLNDTYVIDGLDPSEDDIAAVAKYEMENYTVEELGAILTQMYKNAENKTTAIHMFGLKYGEVITRNGYSAVKLVNASEIPESYHVEVNKGTAIYKSIKDNEYGIHFDDYDIFDANDTKVLGGYNKIFYGAPGCGKSFIINKKLNDANVPEKNRIRVTFHPEYSNCDFIGQILPTIEKKVNETSGENEEVVKYIFNPGPFTLALERANNTNDMVYLIIEEINRGNAAAIFGDLFQLLDRVNDPSKSNLGESEYPICNVNIQKYLNINENDALVIPSNLTIYATMNTSDQNVFTLDTAFKRRWSFEQISNNIEKDTKHKYKGYFVPGTDVTWEKFLTVINKEILKHKITSEDKRMGKYFVSKDCLTEEVRDIVDVKVEAEKFAYKVLEYIWNDVCKISKDDWFDTSVLLTLEDLIDAFVNPKEDESPLAVFKTISFK